MKEKLLLLHGALGSQEQLASIGDLLEKRYEVINLNFSGHGGTPLSQEFSIKNFAQDVISLLDERGIEKINIFGYSMGGYVALYAARHFGNRVGKVVTLGTKLDWTVESSEREIQMLDPEKIELKVPKFAKRLSTTHDPQDWKTVVRLTANMMRDLGLGAKLKGEDFKGIPHEVVIGIGTEDQMVTENESREVTDYLPSGRRHELRGVEHVIDKEDPGVIAGFIIDSLS